MNEHTIKEATVNNIFEEIAKELSQNIKSITYAEVSKHNAIKIYFLRSINLENDFIGRTKEIENISQKYGYWVNTWTATSQKRVYKVSFRKITEEELKLKPIKNYSDDEPTTNEV